MNFPIEIIGHDAYDLVCSLPSLHGDLTGVELALLPFAPLHDERAPMSEADNESVLRAQSLRQQLSLPFWDGAMLSACTAKAVPLGVLAGATFHQALAGYTQSLAIGDLNKETLGKYAEEAGRKNCLLAIKSKLEFNDRINRHMPLIDFHCAFSPTATEVVVSSLKLLKQPGALLSSGKSYHFYGANLLTDEELRIFLGRALLFAPITDKTWIAHQLIEGSCALRISSRKDYGGPPKIIAII